MSGMGCTTVTCPVHTQYLIILWQFETGQVTLQAKVVLQAEVALQAECSKHLKYFKLEYCFVLVVVPIPLNPVCRST